MLIEYNRNTSQLRAAARLTRAKPDPFFIRQSEIGIRQ
jgi:hypothetical protein